MRAYKKIEVNHPILRNLRSALRTVIRQRYYDECKHLRNLRGQLRKKGKYDSLSLKQRKKYDNLGYENRELGYAFHQAILNCDICTDKAGDRIYVPKDGGFWVCPTCYETQLPKSYRQGWKPFYPFDKRGVIEFFRRLQEWWRGDRENIPGGFSNSREILTEMGVSKKEQDKFLDTLKEYAGYDDGEIIMNSWQYVQKDFGLEPEHR